MFPYRSRQPDNTAIGTFSVAFKTAASIRSHTFLSSYDNLNQEKYLFVLAAHAQCKSQEKTFLFQAFDYMTMIKKTHINILLQITFPTTFFYVLRLYVHIDFYFTPGCVLMGVRNMQLSCSIPEKLCDTTGDNVNTVK